jgi:hypothetical protein
VNVGPMLDAGCRPLTTATRSVPNCATFAADSVLSARVAVADRLNSPSDETRPIPRKTSKSAPSGSLTGRRARLWPLLRRLRLHRSTGGDLLQIANDDLVAGRHSFVDDHQVALVGSRRDNALLGLSVLTNDVHESAELA